MARANKKVHMQVLWSSENSVPSLFLFTDAKRYVFNCGEGLQRLFCQRKIKLGKIDKFFLTRYQWSHMGGLPGFGMTLRDMGSLGLKAFIDKNKGENVVPLEDKSTTFKDEDNKKDNKVPEEGKSIENVTKRQLSVYAPYGMKDIFAATKSFLNFDKADTNLKIIEHEKFESNETELYSDDQVTICSILIDQIGEEKSNQLEEKNLLDYIDATPSINPPSICYVCKLPELPGKFDAKNAKKLGVPMGPLCSQLVKGETIVLDNGKAVRPEEVIGPGIPGPCILIVDCPTVLYIESLKQNMNLQKYSSGERDVHLIVHLSPSEVCQHNTYLEWAKHFHPSTKQIYLDKLSQSTSALESQHSMQKMLNKIDSSFFPLMDEHKTVLQSNDLPNDLLKNFVKINLRELINKSSSKVFDESDIVPKVDCSLLMDRVAKVMSENSVICDNSELLSDSSVNINGKRINLAKDDPIPCKKGSYSDDTQSNKSTNISYPKLVILGTGSSMPSKYRNVSGILMFLSEDDAVLLDCGENTYGELFRHYGDQVKEILSKVKFIFVSHMHADHHLGLITLIQKINSLQLENLPSLLIMAPQHLRQWLIKYAKISEPLRFRFISCFDAKEKGFSVLENLHVLPVKVDHPGNAYGAVLKYNESVKITYSGDTSSSSDALITAGKGSTLLIHEATFEDDMVEDATIRKHSTTSQALEVAQKMNAELVLLTHFSQRYPKLPIVKNDFASLKYAFAFDHMEICLNDIVKFHKCVPILNRLLVEDEENENL